MKKISTITFYIICILVTVLSLVFFIPNANVTNVKENRVIIKIWNIDCFEGGSGSRSNFLKNIANNYTKKHSNILFLVTSHTVDSAKELINKGVFPDVISYGACGIEILDQVKIINNYSVRDGGVGGKQRYAVSWCKGNYFHLKRGDGGKVIISSNAHNFSTVAVSLEGLNLSEFEVLSSDVAYQTFLTSKNAELITTQRDVVKLIKRGVEFSCQPLKKYNDLFQYVSVTSLDNYKVGHCKNFIDYLLSEEIQKQLTNINMFSPIFSGLYSDNEYYKVAEGIKHEYTTFCLTSQLDLQNIKLQGEQSLINKNTNELIKSLKQL